MVVRRLQTYIELETTPSTVFRNVRIQELKESYLKEYPGSKVELLFDVECCVYHIFPQDLVDGRYGGEFSAVVEILKVFYQKFNEIGVNLVAFFGNCKSKDRRSQWIARRYAEMKSVNHFMSDNWSLRKMPSELVVCVKDIIRFVLKETIVNSLTENDMEIMEYARKHKSFGILSQDTDFCISNAAQYYLTMRNLCLKDMTTCIYDSHGLADHLRLQENQLPLFATLMGNDIMEEEMFKPRDIQNARYEYQLRQFVNIIASLCRPIECNDKGFPKCENDLEDLAKLTSKNLETKIFVNLMKDSIASYTSYYVEEELLIDRLNISSDQRDLINLAMTLYRQCWIETGVFNLLSRKEFKMATCIEIFHDINIRPIGDVLENLRRVLYGAIFQGDQTVRISEYIITGEGCLDNEIATVAPAQLHSVRRLNDVWRRSLKPGHLQMNKAWELLTKSVSVDKHIWVRVPEHTEDMRKYFVTIVAQSCELKTNDISKLLEILPGLPSEVHVPLFTFLYLDHEPGAFLSSSERDAVLFTFSVVSVLSCIQIQTFSELFSSYKISTSKYSKSELLLRAANMFMKATDLIINLNAVCGFPIPLESVNGNNYWEGSVVQSFYHYLHVEKRTTLDLVQKVHCCLADTRIAQESSWRSPVPLDKFARVLRGCADIGLIDARVYMEFNALKTPSGTPSRWNRPLQNLNRLKDEINQIGFGCSPTP